MMRRYLHRQNFAAALLRESWIDPVPSLPLGYTRCEWVSFSLSYFDFFSDSIGDELECRFCMSEASLVFYCFTSDTSGIPRFALQLQYSGRVRLFADNGSVDIQKNLSSIIPFEDIYDKFHVLKLRYINGKYYLYVDDILLFTADASYETLPCHILRCRSSNLKVSYLKVNGYYIAACFDSNGDAGFYSFGSDAFGMTGNNIHG